MQAVEEVLSANLVLNDLERAFVCDLRRRFGIRRIFHRPDLEESLRVLTGTERRVIALRFAGWRSEAIGQELDVGNARIKQIIIQAERKIAASLLPINPGCRFCGLYLGPTNIASGISYCSLACARLDAQRIRAFLKKG